MARVYGVLSALLMGDVLAAGAEDETATLDLLFMADIGHSRHHADSLTKPWPMNKCAYEGAFSLYEGMQDLVQNQGAKPNAVFIVGDVAYSGGDAEVCNYTRDAFQKYLKGSVPEDRVFPVIGNHDIHYLGCSLGELLTPLSPCYYGTNQYLTNSRYQMPFSQWRQNWIAAFPGLGKAILPPSPEEEADEWIAPFRYNVNLDKKSSVYIIAGLMSGVSRTTWNNDTPAAGLDGAAPGGGAVECRFLRDSLAEGRRLGKTVFIYMTHNFERTCEDWELVLQVDVWITGHKHFYWQSHASGTVTAQELRYFPMHILIGNGGFDEGQSDAVSFGHLREIPYKDESGSHRVRLHFDVYDTCISDQLLCPSLGLGGPYCWQRCKSMPGGVDGGGGPRKATPGKQGTGFSFDAPKTPKDARKNELIGTPWRMRIETTEGARFLALSPCPGSGNECLFPSAQSSTSVPIYLAGYGQVHKDGAFHAALSPEGQRRASIVQDVDRDIRVLALGFGYWDKTHSGKPKNYLADAAQFDFWKEGDNWQMRGLAITEDDDGVEFFCYDLRQVYNVTFEIPERDQVAKIFV